MTTTAHESALAAAFASSMPTSRAVTPIETKAAGGSGAGLVFSFVGALSADVAVTIIDSEALTDGLDDAALNYRLHEAINAAVGTLGAGTVTDTRTGDVSDVFADSGATMFDLTTDDGTVIGHLAVCITRNEGVAQAAPNMSRIANVELALSVEVGRTVITTRKALELRSGDIVELDRAAGAPVDIKLNGRVFAHGEVVVQNGDYAVRVTRILDTPR